MRRLSLCLALCAAVLVHAPVGGVQAAVVPSGGPNPNWTEMQKFEWYLGYLARAAQMCGAYSESAVLTRLARMSPYGDVGLGQNSADDFLGTACVGFRADAKDLVTDADKIEDYIEATYDCSDDGCFGQDLSDWQFHECGNALKAHFAILALDDGDIRAVTMLNPAKTGSDAAYQARVQFHSCQGSLYIDLTPQCVMERKQTRGDCAFDGIERY